jgi:hypothetical protein
MMLGVPASERTHHDVALRKAVLMIKTRGGAAWGGAVVVAG